MKWKSIIVRPETYKLLEKMKKKGFNSFNEAIYYCVKVCQDGTKGSIIRLSEMEAERITPSEFMESAVPITQDIFSNKLKKRVEKIV